MIEEIDIKTFTADQFRRNPAPVYRAADKLTGTDEKVIINHGQYSDIVFELTARERRKEEPNND